MAGTKRLSEDFSFFRCLKIVVVACAVPMIGVVASDRALAECTPPAGGITTCTNPFAAGIDLNINADLNVILFNATVTDANPPEDAAAVDIFSGTESADITISRVQDSANSVTTTGDLNAFWLETFGGNITINAINGSITATGTNTNLFNPTDQSNGILALSWGHNDGGTGTILMDLGANDLITSTGHGIYADATDNPFSGPHVTSGDIDITTRAAVAGDSDDSGDGSGIVAIAAATGHVNLNVFADISAGGDGLRLFTVDGDIDVNLGVAATLSSRSASSGGNGISAAASGIGNVTLDLEGDVDTATATTEIAVATITGTSTINVLGTSSINSTGSADDQVIFGTGAVVVDNLGEILGRLAFAGSSNQVMNNHSDLTWQFTGTTDFGPGTGDAINNDGTIATVSTTPSDDDDTFITGLEFFNNGTANGLGTLTMQDGFAGDTTTISSTIDGDLIFAGSTLFGSTLAIDALLGDLDSSNADKLVIDGDVAGSTTVALNDVTGGPGAYDPTGRAVVDVSGTTGLGDFALQGGPIDKGLFTYDLFLDPSGGGSGCTPGDNCWVLASNPDSSALALAQMVGITQDIWHMTGSGVLEDRTAYFQNMFGATPIAYAEPIEQGDGLGPNVETGYVAPSAAPYRDTAIWGRFIVSSANRDTSQTFELFPGQPTTVQGDYDQELWAFQAGIDRTFSFANGTMVAGVLVGYVDTSADFTGGDSASFAGPSVGVYAEWARGPLYVNGVVKADFLDVDYNVGGQSGSTDATAVGVEMETGYRFAMGNVYFQPLGNLAYVHSSIDDTVINGTPVNFEDGDSLRGKVGAKVGGAWVAGSVSVEPYAVAAVGYEFLGDNSVFLASGPGVTVNDDISGVFGEIGAGVNVAGSGGWSAFANAKYIVGEGYDAGVARVGARYGW